MVFKEILLFGITYETWHAICQMYLKVGKKYYKTSIQWFPFCLLSDNDWEWLSSQLFFDIYIKTGTFVFSPQLMHRSENYLSKSDGSFRDASLISPILYLILQSIGKQVADTYISQRPPEISVYYAGNYPNDRVHYKKDYDDFYKEINAATEEYQYFIKTDITSFFANIDLNLLINRINEICNRDNVIFSQTQLFVYKEFLSYCGNGKFPLIENSVASSFLATIVYLDTIDCKIYQYISEKINCFSSFKMFRYVDDLYILFSSESPEQTIHSIVNEIRNEYSSVLKESGLTLNTKKFRSGQTININEELKKSLYDEYVNGVDFSIEEGVHPSLEKFLERLSFHINTGTLDIENYNQSIEDSFQTPDLEYTANELFNHCVYGSNASLQGPSFIEKLKKILQTDVSFIALDPKRLTVMIVKTQNGELIKILLNHLFIRNRNGQWNYYDTTIAVVYFIQSFFRHIDLLEVLRSRCPDLFAFYETNCRQKFLTVLEVDQNPYYQLLLNDPKSCLFYFMYFIELKRGNINTAFAYFKNFFDRITAILAFNNGKERKKIKQPNFKRYFQQDNVTRIYEHISGSRELIEKAFKLRNANPLAHASAELWDKNTSKNEILETIKDLKQLILNFLIKIPLK